MMRELFITVKRDNRDNDDDGSTYAVEVFSIVRHTCSSSTSSHTNLELSQNFDDRLS
jgi:hypothetical protein